MTKPRRRPLPWLATLSVEELRRLLREKRRRQQTSLATTPPRAA